MRPETANLLMCKQWWKSCWVYGDQYKQYRHLLSKKTKINTLRTNNSTKDGSNFINVITAFEDKSKMDICSIKNEEKEKEALGQKCDG